MKDNTPIKKIADNRAAYHNYFVEEKYEAGIELLGNEVKSLRAAKMNFKDSWVQIENGEAFVVAMHISPYDKGNIWAPDPLRRRRLLLHKREIIKLQSEVSRAGKTLIPLSLYFKHGKVKMSVGICKGKDLHDKRRSAAEKDIKREIDRAMKTR
ncbi:MAG: SsrA-binding protein SmpB [Oscillospiraceae bacterium]|jgi:SsrA-binding protein|nr:SsrA-binding protein SmpB [Oscillospiraceae bacterium]